MTYVKRFVTMYMHTLNGKPAFYEPHRQICFVTRTHAAFLYPSLAEIRRNQRASRAWCEANDVRTDDLRYGYVRVRVLIDLNPAQL